MFTYSLIAINIITFTFCLQELKLLNLLERKRRLMQLREEIWKKSPRQLIHEEEEKGNTRKCIPVCNVGC